MDELMKKQLEELFLELQEILLSVEKQVEKEKQPILVNGDERLSKYFLLSEFVNSNVAARNNINNSPNAEERKNMKDLCVNVLDPVREHFNRPVVLSSGFRSKELNTKVRGSKTSDHRFGCAADFEIKGISNYEVAKWIEDNLEYKQLILEFNEPSQPNSGWIHCSYKEGVNKKQSLRAVKRNRRTKYLPGLRG